MAKNSIIAFDNITRVFGDFLALEEVSFEIRENEVHSIVGENGAGKSTLMNILVGINKPSLGHIELHGTKVKIKNVRHAFELKIALVPQNYELVENMSVEENIILGYENLHKQEGTTTTLKDLIDEYNLHINLRVKVSELTSFEKQKIEILKSLWRGAEIIIFDEPTSYFTHSQTKEFNKMLKIMQKQGKTIIINTSKADVAISISDRISIMRKGRFIQTRDAKKVSEKEVTEMMFNREVDLRLNRIKKLAIDHSNEDILVIRDLSNKEELSGINLTIKPGEIVGIAATEGNGQSELIKAIAGMIKVKGKIAVGGTEIQNNSIHDRYFNKDSVKEMEYQYKDSYETAIEYLKNDLNDLKNLIFLEENKSKKKKMVARVKPLKKQIYHLKVLKNRPRPLISHIPEDRHLYGMILDYSIAKNAVLQDIDFYTKRGMLNYKDINLKVNSMIEKYDIQGVKNNRMKVRDLTIANQQKFIVAREIERRPLLLLASFPTRDLDITAIKNVYESIIEARNNGVAVLLNSDNLNEIMQVSDRIIVMHEGKIVSTSKRGELSKAILGSLMEGAENV